MKAIQVTAGVLMPAEESLVSLTDEAIRDEARTALVDALTNGSTDVTVTLVEIAPNGVDQFNADELRQEPAE